jgi:hypothetical protein
MSKNTSKYRICQLKQEILQLDKKLSNPSQVNPQPLRESNRSSELEANDVKCSF